MRKIFRLAEKTLFFSAEKKMNDYRLPEKRPESRKTDCRKHRFFSIWQEKACKDALSFCKRYAFPHLRLLRQPAQDAPFRQAFGKQNSFSTDIPLPPDGARLAYLQ